MNNRKAMKENFRSIVRYPKASVPTKTETSILEGIKTVPSETEGINTEPSESIGINLKGTNLIGSNTESTIKEAINTKCSTTKPSIKEAINLKGSIMEGSKMEDTEEKGGLYYTGNYFCMENDITPLVSTLKEKYKISPSTILLYIAYIRGSWGFHKNSYNSGDKILMENSFIEGKGSFYRCKQELFAIGLIKEVQGSNKRSNNYDTVRVFAPHEMLEKLGKETKTRLNTDSSRCSNSEASDMEGIISEGSIKSDEGLKMEPSDLRPIKYNNIKNNIKINYLSSSSTNEQKEQSEEKNEEEVNLNLLGEFYALFNLKPASDRRERELPIIEKLLKEFDREVIAFAFKWLKKHCPDTNSISRLPFYMDQALRDYGKHKEAEDLKAREQEKAKEAVIAQKHAEVMDEKVSKIMKSLTNEQMEELQVAVKEEIKNTKVPNYLVERFEKSRIKELVAVKFVKKEEFQEMILS